MSADYFSLPPTAPPWRALEERVAALELRVMELQRGWMDLTEALAKQHRVIWALEGALKHDWSRGDFKWRETDVLPTALREALK